MFNELNEDKRAELVARSRKSDKEKDGKTRYDKRVKSSVATSTRQYNKIDMNQLFTNNILTVNIEVRGETDDYIVTMKFGGFLDQLHRELASADNKLDLRVIIRALVDSFNSDNVYIHCSCNDWQYRMAYYATLNDINSGSAESRPSDITNPNDSKGPGCKHSLLVLSNHSWLIRVASVIMNYTKYMEKHRQRLYADIIYPSIYGVEYKEPVQMSLDDTSDELATDTSTIDSANKENRVRTQFKTGNEYRIPKGYNQPDTQQSMFDDNTEER